MKASQLYERDFFEWTQCNAALLRNGQFDQADIEHIAEEIEDMGSRDRRELESRLQVLAQHLWKWQFQPERRSRSWRDTIQIQRLEIVELLEEMPSLQRALHAGLNKVYQRSIARVVIETSLPEATFPSTAPFTLEQMLDREYFPE
jgi:hypothetical protein